MDPLAVTAFSALATALATGVMVWAVYVAPKKAFEAQWELQLRHEARQRRVQVFVTLMATRGNALHYRHVEALNLIDVEFSDVAEKDVRDAWKSYLDHLNVRAPDEKSEPDEVKRKAFQQRHEESRRDLLAELLQKMGARLGYKFDFTYLKDRGYYPEGHGTVVEEESALRRGLIEILWHGRPLNVRAVNPPSAEDTPSQ